MKNINIAVNDSTPFYYGMKLYMITKNRRNSEKLFSEKCPVCGDSHIIEVPACIEAQSTENKTYTFKCPMCNGGTVSKGATRIFLFNFDVRMFILNKVEIVGSMVKSDYTMNSKRLPIARWYGFTRWGAGTDEYYTRAFYEFRFDDVDVEAVELSRVLNRGICFYSKAEAERFCRRLHERQKELLEKFNAEHGTSHEYPFIF